MSFIRQQVSEYTTEMVEDALANDATKCPGEAAYQSVEDALAGFMAAMDAQGQRELAVTLMGQAMQTITARATT